MNIIRHITGILAAALFLCACSDSGTIVGFELDRNRIEAGPAGGTQRIVVTSDDAWVATTDNPWITVTPANGRGSAECELIIDSALTDRPRSGLVRIQNRTSAQSREIVVEQEGYGYAIELADTEVGIPNYGAYGTRHFDVKVLANTDFRVDIPVSASSWLTCTQPKLNLDRGIRPREVTLRFEWSISSVPVERIADVTFSPREAVELIRQDALRVVQEAAEPIKENSREGDSVALLGIARTLGTTEWDSSSPMNTWSGVSLWEEGMEGWTPEKDGRVKYAYFFMFATRESLPYEVRYLTAADELVFFSNTNAFLYSLDPGEYITELTQLRRLTISSYGLTSLPASFTRLENLEYLNLSSNNFQSIPAILKSPDNFPKLRALVLNANQRRLIFDLSNSVATNIGGFIEETSFPVELLKRDLDTLVLGVNYLQGEIPTFENDPDFPCYTDEDIASSWSEKLQCDTLPRLLVERRVPKVMPRTKLFSINYNRLYGTLPDWLLYHPALDWWFPFNLVFNQEGRAENGRAAGFSNEPANLNYYYDIYTTKTKPTGSLE